MSDVSSLHLSDLSDADHFHVASIESDKVFSYEKWSNTVIDHEIEDFLGVTGLTVPLAADAKPVEYFLQLFP